MSWDAGFPPATLGENRMQIFTNTVLTGSYQHLDSPRAAGRGAGFLYVNYAKGTETGLTLLVELSPQDDPTNQYSVPLIDGSGNVTPGPLLLAASGNYRFAVPAGYHETNVRVSVKATGGTPTGTVNAYLNV
jgi:hypothetical protein